MNPSPASTDLPACHNCGRPVGPLAAGYVQLHRVTSDCKPWPPGGQLARCPHCHLVQTLLTPAWHAEAKQIYDDYTIYHQSGGAEQQVFSGSTGEGLPRSARIIQALRDRLELPPQGRLWDVGCGNGAFLAAWSRMSPGWSLCGSEVNDKYRKEVQAIPGVEGLHTGTTEEVPGEFDLISMIHVFEHIPAPAKLLARLRRKLRPGGLLLIEVPDCEQNPFMLLVADHCSHFSPPLLAGVVESAGFDVIEASSAWVAKEVSLVASLSPLPSPVGRERVPEGRGRETPQNPRDLDEAAERLLRGCQRLAEIAAKVGRLSTRSNFGLFGTAIGATWLDAQTKHSARFFVDEDANRIGRAHLGRPILSPSNVPAGATVFVGLPSPLADLVAARLRQTNPTVEVILP